MGNLLLLLYSGVALLGMAFVIMLAGIFANLNRLIKKVWFEDFAHWILRTGSTIFLPQIKVFGLEKIEHLRGKPAIIIGNHRSILDVMIPLFLSLRVRYLAKAELRKVPFMGSGMNATHHMFVERGSSESRARSMEQIKLRLQKWGYWVTVFPEGTRNATNKPLLPFKKGVFRICEELKVPLVIMAIRGAGDILPKKSLRFRKWHPVEMHVLAVQESANPDLAFEIMEKFLKT